MATYTVDRVIGNYYIRTRKLEFYILEDGIAIAKVTRPQYGHELKFKWYTDRAQFRFMDFANACSMEETCEALLGHFHTLVKRNCKR